MLKCVLLTLLLIHGCCTTTEDALFWRRVGKEELNRILGLTPNTNKAKNVILMVGDGMGLSTVMAARVLKGQLQNKTGEETMLSFEKFPHLALSKVYTTDKQVPDSAASATAMLSGVKTKSKVIGLDGTVEVGQSCSDSLKKSEVSSMLNWSQAKGKSTGVVTTTRITHATPAATYAHTTHRDWESDVNIPYGVKGCHDIASQLIDYNPGIEVILGGGRRSFLRINQSDPTTGTIDYNNQRRDGVDLVDKWKKNKLFKKSSYNYVWNKGQFDKINASETDYLLGLFANSHMAYELDRDKGPLGEPSLAEMTTKAIEILQKNSKGFFLMVEGGRIDHAHHVNNAKRALYDTLAFEEAVDAAVSMTNESDTLIIVTADHSHVMTVSGYPDRGNGILDLVKPLTGEHLATDGYPYTTLTYANGPSYSPYRMNLTSFEVEGDNYNQVSAVPLYYETHSGEDVGIYARGPMSHLFTGVKEQNYIAFVMAHAACVGDTGIPCGHGRAPDQNQQTSTPCPNGERQSTNNGDSGAARILCPALLKILYLYVLFQLL